MASHPILILAVFTTYSIIWKNCCLCHELHIGHPACILTHSLSNYSAAREHFTWWTASKAAHILRWHKSWLYSLINITFIEFCIPLIKPLTNLLVLQAKLLLSTVSSQPISWTSQDFQKIPFFWLWTGCVHVFPFLEWMNEQIDKTNVCVWTGD